MEQTLSFIIALVTLIAAVSRPVIRLNGNIVRLTEIVDGFEKTLERLELALERLRDGNKHAHKMFYDRLDRAEKTLGEHDLRISRLEKHG